MTLNFRSLPDVSPRSVMLWTSGDELIISMILPMLDSYTIEASVSLMRPPPADISAVLRLVSRMHSCSMIEIILFDLSPLVGVYSHQSLDGSKAMAPMKQPSS